MTYKMSLNNLITIKELAIIVVMIARMMIRVRSSKIQISSNLLFSHLQVKLRLSLLKMYNFIKARKILLQCILMEVKMTRRGPLPVSQL